MSGFRELHLIAGFSAITEPMLFKCIQLLGPQMQLSGRELASHGKALTLILGNINKYINSSFSGKDTKDFASQGKAAASVLWGCVSGEGVDR